MPSPAPVVILFVVAFAPLVAFLGRLFYITRIQPGAKERRTAEAADGGGTSSQALALKKAKAEAALVSFGIRGAAASVGWLMMLFGFSTWFCPRDVWPMNFMTTMIFWPVGGTCLLLAVRQTDKVGILVASIVLFAVSGVFFTVNPLLLTLTDPILSTRGIAGVAPILPIVTINLLVAVSLTRNWMCCCEERMGAGRAQLNRLWRGYRIFCGSMTVFFGFVGLAGTPLVPPVPIPSQYANLTTAELALISPAVDPGNAPGAAATALLLLFNCIFMKPAVRRKVHSLLGSIAAKGEARAAAAVAGLVGGRSPEAALKHGTSTFKGLPIDQLSEADFSTSGDTGLHEKTVKANLGQVHGFLSHSWHDPAAAKWQALQTWSTAKKANGPQPLLWLDKACIDQQRIDESLAALPVYLSGCQELLVVVGPTYTRRLWCVMELFVFLQMGGSLDRVTSLALPGKEVQRELATFQAEQAQCFKAEDRERLLGIVESAFGDFAAFNAKVRGLFSKKSITMDNLPTAGSKGGSQAKYKVAQVAPAES